MSQANPQSAPIFRFLNLVLRRGESAPSSPARRWSVQCLTGTDPRLAEVVRVPLMLPRLPLSLHGLTVAQISDLHAGVTTDAARIRQFVEMTNTLGADIAVITGDMVQGGAESVHLCARELAALHAPLGVYAIMGNHERRLPPDVGEAPFRRVGLTVLCNKPKQVTRDGGTVWIVGVDDILMRRGDLSLALNGVPADACKILLVHEPDFADQAARFPIDLQLSGHTHGGQIRLPGIGPLLLPILGRKYPMGVYRVRDTWVYTNRGLGVNHPAVRLNCRPEITVFTLHSPAARETPTLHQDRGDGRSRS